MKPFYSIIYAVIRPEIDEKISVGIILLDKNQVSLSISENKVSLLKKTVSKNYLNSIKFSLSLIERSFILKQGSSNNPQRILELQVKDKSDVFNYSYIEYLSRYNSNVLTFSEPIEINLKITNDLFLKLFHKFVDKYENKQKEKKQITKFEAFKKKFYPEVEPYFNIEHEIDSFIYPDLIMPISLDLMGKNENEVFAQSVDMSKTIITIERGIADLLIIKRALPEAKQFLISSEPDKLNQINHNIWGNVRKMKEFEYVDLSETEKISEYAKKHGVLPLIKE
ncbi:MAG: hypothetical protein GXO80_10250 [Chlorobi bacterium]|nr:hypothetical protein [Chlorobiota bacterium]